jgi:ubiquinone biosynthesis protein UbiJ
VAGDTEKEDLQAIRADLAELAAEMDRISGDISKENVPPGELDAAYEDLTRLKLEIEELVARVAKIEERDGNR